MANSWRAGSRTKARKPPPLWKISCTHVSMLNTQFKKILFPVDFSESCRGAARYVELFAGQFEAEIMLLHVVGMGVHGLPEDLLPGRKAQLNSFLAGELKYFATRRVCKTGDPACIIAEEARAWQPDLVMMPTHGCGFFRRFLLGSVASKVLYDLACPAWTSVHVSAAPPLENIHCRRILCGVDLGERSREILAWSAWLACEFQAELAIVQATPPIDTSEGGWYLGEDFATKALESVRSRIAKLKSESGTEGAHVFLKTGKFQTAIAQAATEFCADLLVIGRHGEGRSSGGTSPRAYSILSHSPYPVISI